MKKVLYIILIFFSTSGIFAQKNAPDFKVTDIYGHLHHLSVDYLDNDKYVFIDFFTTPCVSCQELAPKIDTVFKEFGCNYGEIIFLGIDMFGDDENIWNFTRDFSMTFPAISGQEGGGSGVFGLYNIGYTPYKIIISPSGEIISDNPEINSAAQLRDSLTAIGFSQQQCQGNDFLFYSIISETDSVVGDIDYENQSIDIDLPIGTDITNLISTFVNAVNSTIEIDGEPQISGKTVLDFSGGPLVYQITSEDGYSEDWTVNIQLVAPVNYYSTNLNIYPNPSKGIFSINISGFKSKNIKLNISDITGKQVYNTDVSDEKININISNKPTGIYIMNLYIDNTVISKKIIKNR